MKKILTLLILLGGILLVPAVTQAEAMSLRDYVVFFIKAGIISPDKSEQALSAVGALENPISLKVEVNPACVEMSNTLARGSVGDDVLRLASFLKSQGYTVELGNAFVFNPSLETAVRQFQIDRVLSVTGRADEATVYEIHKFCPHESNTDVVSIVPQSHETIVTVLADLALRGLLAFENVGDAFSLAQVASALSLQSDVSIELFPAGGEELFVGSTYSIVWGELSQNKKVKIRIVGPVTRTIASYGSGEAKPKSKNFKISSDFSSGTYRIQVCTILESVNGGESCSEGEEFIIARKDAETKIKIVTPVGGEVVEVKVGDQWYVQYNIMNAHVGEIREVSLVGATTEINLTSDVYITSKDIEATLNKNSLEGVGIPFAYLRDVPEGQYRLRIKILKDGKLVSSSTSNPFTIVASSQVIVPAPLVSPAPTAPQIPPITPAILVNPITTSPASFSVSCSASLSSAVIGQPVTWAIEIRNTGKRSPSVYSWSGTDGLVGTTRIVNKNYSSAGFKSASVVVTSGGQTVTRNCDGLLVVARDASITVQSPNGEERILTSSEFPVKWRPSEAATVDIILQKINSSSLETPQAYIARSVPNNGYYTWRVGTPSPFNQEDQYVIKICDSARICDLSDKPFLFKAAPSAGSNTASAADNDSVLATIARFAVQGLIGLDKIDEALTVAEIAGGINVQSASAINGYFTLSAPDKKPAAIVTSTAENTVVQAGTFLTVNTKNTEVPANTFVTVALVSKTKSISLLVPCTAGWFKEMSERCRDVSGGNGDRTWSLYIPKNAAPGVYKIEVSFWSKQSDHFFIARAVSENTITISRTPYQEVIVIRSPRQGEILGAGTTYRIEWETPVTNISKFTIFAVSDGTALMSIELTPAEAKCFQGSSKMICSYVWIPRIARENVKLSITDGTNKTELAPLTIMSF